MMMKQVNCWLSFLEDELTDEDVNEMQKRESSNHPLGSKTYQKVREDDRK